MYNYNTKTDYEIEELKAEAVDQVDSGESKFPGMSYEEGIIAVLDWLSGDGENPLND